MRGAQYAHGHNPANGKQIGRLGLARALMRLAQEQENIPWHVSLDDPLRIRMYNIDTNFSI